MKSNETELMWAREHWSGNIWVESARSTQGVLKHWPPVEDGDKPKTEREITEQWGKIKLFKVTFEPVPEDEQDKYLKKQQAFFRGRRKKEKQRREEYLAQEPKP